MRAKIMAALLACAGPAAADDGRLALQLNALQQLDTGCRLAFTVRNGLDRSVDRLVYETVLFDTDGAVALLTLLDFQDVPQGRLRVRQFDVPELSCDALGGVLVNGAASCEVGGASADICGAATEMTSRTDVEVLR